MSTPAVAAPSDVPAGYSLVNATPSGKAMATEKATPSTVNDALEAGLDDLDNYFDDDYDAEKFEDQRTHRSGIANFQAVYKGKPVKGFVMAHLRDKGAGATLVIVFANANVTQAEWAKLTGVQAAPVNNQLANNQGRNNQSPPNEAAFSPQGNTRGQAQYAQPQPAPAPQQVALRTYRFPDGTGSIDLAPGWTTNAQSCQSGFVIAGPNDQKISMGMTLSVNTPNSTAVQLARQYPTNVPMVVAPYGEPANVLQALIPQLSTLQQRNGGPAVALDHVATVKQLPALNANGKNALLTYGVTHALNGRQAHYQAIAEVSVTPTSNESFMVWTIECAAPDATAQRDIPLMLAMANSWKTNDAAIQQNTNAWVANSNAAFNAGQAANRDLQNTYSQYNAAQANNSVRQSRAVDNYIETIRGVRDIQDTTTGETTSVNLGNVDHIVDNLNQYDPGRYIQVPLRDQADPLPGR
jgi:hypothetical protein